MPEWVGSQWGKPVNILHKYARESVQLFPAVGFEMGEVLAKKEQLPVKGSL